MVQGVPGRLRPQIILTFRHYKGVRSSAKRTGRLYPRRNPWYSFSGAESIPGHMVLSEETTEEIPSDTTGNRSRNRPTLTTMLPQVPPVVVQFGSIHNLYSRTGKERTYLFTPWSRVLLEKLTGSAASQEIPRIFGTRRFITVLTSARHRTSGMNM